MNVCRVFPSSLKQAVGISVIEEEQKSRSIFPFEENVPQIVEWTATAVCSHRPVPGRIQRSVELSIRLIDAGKDKSFSNSKTGHIGGDAGMIFVQLTRATVVLCDHNAVTVRVVKFSVNTWVERHLIAYQPPLRRSISNRKPIE